MLLLVFPKDESKRRERLDTTRVDFVHFRYNIHACPRLSLLSWVQYQRDVLVVEPFIVVDQVPSGYSRASDPALLSRASADHSSLYVHRMQRSFSLQYSGKSLDTHGHLHHRLSFDLRSHQTIDFELPGKQKLGTGDLGIPWFKYNMNRILTQSNRTLRVIDARSVHDAFEPKLAAVQRSYLYRFMVSVRSRLPE